jgi:UDP-N-acetylglucosamine--N-acetylmuramyl-(pentapeptide) pyrophosphoryl-undecaprenol N-acetylglucosamine transferase
VRSFWTIWRGVRQASEVIRRIKPEVAVGFGGYPTIPPLYAASRRGVPTIIHEQNAVMGRANRALAAKAAAIAGGFLPEGGGQYGAKTVVTGNPVRPAVLAAAGTPYAPSRDGQPFRLLVFGGSQGAQFFSDAIPAAVALLPQETRTRLLVTQQARADDVGRVKAAYAELGMVPEVLPFFTDMAQRIAAAHLVISRSGASTVSEISVIGRPALLVPYPYALDHDQAANAAALAAAGGAELHPQSTLSTERLAGLIGDAISEPERLESMASAAKSAGKPDAARLLADLAEAIASGKSVEEFRKGARP